MLLNVKSAFKDLEKATILVVDPSILGFTAFLSDSSGLEAKPYFSIVPKNIEELAESVKILVKHKVPMTVKGSGTSTAASSVADNSVLISTIALNKIKVHEDDFMVEVEPGVITGNLKKKVLDVGLFYPPDPASFEYSTIGGNILTNAGGPSSVKYGTTRDYLKAIDIIDGKGQELSFGRMVHKYSSGYFLPALFAGSEGTLGVLKRAYLKLLPSPQFHSYMKVESPKYDDFNFFRKFPVANLEYISAITAELVTKKRESVILLMFEEFTEEALHASEMVVELALKKKGYHFIKSSVKDDIWEIRKKLSRVSYKLGEKKVSQDVVVPLSKVSKIVSLVESRANEEKNVKISLFGHLGDGNLHINIMTENVFIENALNLQRWIMNEVFLAKGVPSGEHGVGITRKKFLNDFFKKEEIETMKNIKKIFDPYSIMNPGKVF